MEEFCQVRDMTRAELNLFAPQGKYISGRFFKSLTISPEYFLPWAMDQFKSFGGTFVKRKISSWNDLEGWYVGTVLSTDKDKIVHSP